MTGGAQACLRPSLILFSFCPVCPVCLQKSSSVPSVSFLRSPILTLLWVDRLFCKTPPVVLYKVLCIKGLYDHQPPVRPHVRPPV